LIFLIRSYVDDDDDANIKEEPSSSIDDDNLGTQIDHTLINALSASREKFPTSINNLLLFLVKLFFSISAHLKKWLREHRTHPYPSNQEKIELAKQSLITYDQVTTWFNNARAILRRRQAKLRHPLDSAEDDDNDDDDEQSKKHSDSSKSKTKN
jgi:hypothetical protein